MTTPDAHGHAEDQYAAARVEHRRRYPHFYTWHYRLRHTILPRCWGKIPLPIRVILIILGYIVLMPSADSWWGS